MGVWDTLEGFDPIGLDELDRRASLQHRVDHKYVVDQDQLAAFLRDCRSDHEVLEIEGGRSFAYRSVYFDTPSLTCFVQHLQDRKPRYKLRTRHYVTTKGCVFEVKVKQEDGETAKWSVGYGADDQLTEAAYELIDEALGSCGIELPQHLEPTLVTEFTRSTIALREGTERVTLDRGVRLTCPSGDALVLHDDRALLETKTEDGDGRSDRALADAGAERVSFSKYRLGVGQLMAAQDDSDYAGRLLGFFERETAADDDPASRIFDAQRSAELGTGLQPNSARVLGT